MLARIVTVVVATLLATILPTTVPAASPPPAVTVFAAASLSNVLTELGGEYTKRTGVPVKFSFAASSLLARQIEAGAAADVFFSADAEWMDYLDERGRLRRNTRHDVVGNRLVLIAPADSTVDLTIEPRFALAAALGGGRLATGDPDSVPVGRYARSALTSLGVWNDVVGRLVRAEDVRSAMAFVARGEAPLGIVYETDARVDRRVRVVARFPESSHAPITYPLALTTVARAEAAPFVQFLRGDVGRAAFERFGFRTLK